MYCLFSIILFISAILCYYETGNFDYFWKLLIASGIFGFCDAVNNCSLKQLFFTYKSMYDNKMSKKDCTNEEK